MYQGMGRQQSRGDSMIPDAVYVAAVKVFGIMTCLTLSVFLCYLVVAGLSEFSEFITREKVRYYKRKGMWESFKKWHREQQRNA
jgi:hypothetical protein